MATPIATQSNATLPDFIAVIYHYAGDSLLEFRALPSRKTAFIPVNDTASLRAFVRRDEDLYVGVASRKDSSSGAATNLHELPALFVDIDFKDLDETEARARLAAFPPPTALIQSGGGLHPWWSLVTPLNVTAPEGCTRAKGLLRRLATALGGDLAAAEPARILRLPGSKNHKYDPPRLVTIELLDASRRYTLDELTAHLPAEPTKTTTATANGTTITEGRRNAHLAKLGGTMRRPGMTVQAIEAALLAENAATCVPPLDDAEVRAIAASIGRYEPAEPKAATSKPKPQGREVAFEDTEPADHAVGGDALLGEIADTFGRYLALPEHAAVALALWTLHAWCLAAAFCSPLLALTSPAKRCGKTTLLAVLGALVPRRLFAANVTPAVLFRTVEKYAPTLLIDEADTFIKDNDELRGVINSGHARTTAVVIRAVGDDHDPRAFSTWCAKAIAMIGKLPETLHDRSIEIRMRRRMPREAVSRLRQDRIGDECLALRRDAARWATDHQAALLEADAVVPAGLSDRAADSWRPLLAIADAAGGAWPTAARKAALALSGVGAEAEADTATMLLADIREIFAAEGDPDVLASKAIIEALTSLEDRPWDELSKGRPLTAAKLSNLLGAYGIHSAGTVRIGSRTAKGYRRVAFLDAWERYLRPVEASRRHIANESGPERPISSRHTPKHCDGLRSVTTSMNPGRCDGVTPSETLNYQAGGDRVRLFR